MTGQSGGVTQGYQDHGLAVLNSRDLVSLSWLNSLTGGVQSVPAYENIIATLLIPSDIRMVLFDIGWQNYSIGKVPYEPWVADWLTASDIEGIQNVLFLSQMTQIGAGSKWIMSFIQSDPYAHSY